VMGKRGFDTLTYGPLKPVGLIDERVNVKSFAVVQLRKENKSATMYNLVGFQTNLKFSEQKNVFTKIPGLENADFLRYGVMHRNTFINSPKLLTKHLNLKDNNKVFFAGQITGVEGYTESAMCGMMASLNVLSIIKSGKGVVLPKTTMMGALIHHITDETVSNFQPMTSNMGVLPSLEERIRDKKLRYENISKRSLEFDFEQWKRSVL
ncbi:MAG: methylenetetrahydrofolate--tRNA-(uracil(54)-C(5))-methyltransferase (FADH(2)-oxidizing) TrmFO, partial [Oscillospiraceae bacterium]